MTAIYKSGFFLLAATVCSAAVLGLAGCSAPQDKPAEGQPLSVTTADPAVLRAYGRPVMVAFMSQACTPCTAMDPAVEKLHAEWQGRAVIQRLDVGVSADAVRDLPVPMVPSQLFFNADGTPYVPGEVLSGSMDFFMHKDKSGKHVYTTHQGMLTEAELRVIFREMGVN